MRQRMKALMHRQVTAKPRDDNNLIAFTGSEVNIKHHLRTRIILNDTMTTV
jgi:hypothetical protein